MKKPDILYGVYNMDLASWEFFFSEEKGKKFQNLGDNRFGPVMFPFWNAWDQFRLDLVADGAREPSEEEFLKVIQGEKIDFYEENDGDLEFGQEDRLEPPGQPGHRGLLNWVRFDLSRSVCPADICADR